MHINYFYTEYLIDFEEAYSWRKNQDQVNHRLEIDVGISKMDERILSGKNIFFLLVSNQFLLF